VVAGYPINFEHLDPDNMSDLAFAPTTLGLPPSPPGRPAVCRRGGFREPAAGQLDLCSHHDDLQRRLRETLLDPRHLTSAELRDLRMHRA